MIDSFLKYLRFEKRVSNHTALAYQRDLQQFATFLEKTFPDFTITSADYGVVRAWIITLKEEGLEETSINRKIACLRTYYKFLRRREQIGKDPMQKISMLKAKKKLPSFVKVEEMNTHVLDKVDNFSDTLEGWRDKLIIELFYATGIRLTELINLKEDRIDLHNRTIKVLGKRNKERIIPFTAGIVKTIEGYRTMRNKYITPKDHGYFFVTDSGDPCYPMMIYRRVKKFLSATTAEKKSPHVLRHTYATHLLDKGAEINAVKDLLGHSSLAATQVYTHNSMEKLKNVFDQAHPKA